MEKELASERQRFQQQMDMEISKATVLVDRNKELEAEAKRKKDELDKLKALSQTQVRMSGWHTASCFHRQRGAVIRQNLYHMVSLMWHRVKGAMPSCTCLM